MLETLKNEISKHSAVSFDIEDTLLLYNTMYPADIFRPIDDLVQRKYHVAGFSYIRSEIMQLLFSKLKAPKETLFYTDLFAQMQEQLKVSGNELAQIEMDFIDQYTISNPILLELYNFARQLNKQIFIVADSIYPADFWNGILRKKGIVSYDRLYLTGETGLSKSSGSLYRHILQAEQLTPENWLHIGDNLGDDFQVPAGMGIACYFYKPLRDRYFAEKSESENSLQKLGPELSEAKPDQDLFQNSVEKAKIVNPYYTTIMKPSSDVVIHVENVSMLFNLSSEKIDSIKEYIIKFLRRQLMFQEFWALKNVSFDVHKGEKVGLVGLNGSGKSTMLKIVAGVMSATKGSVSVRGRIAPLIELGAGFDLDLTAKENIFLNGTILGYQHREMENRYREIIDFSELKDFENVPIKNFSSGMVARLGFAIATCHVPDILIIDEILSVGDFEFQKKCHAKMQELAGKGTTVLFVSHSAADIINMCDRAVWLDHGQVVDIGEAEYIVNKYLHH